MSDMIDLNNVDLGIENLGEVWENFIATCTPHQAILFNESYNLIALSFPEGMFDTKLITLFIDENLTTAELIANVRVLFIDTIIETLQMMGIVIDKDFIELNSLVELKNTLDTIYLLDQMTDMLGLVEIINTQETDCKERFIEVCKVAQPQCDFDNLDYFIKEVSPNTLRGLLIGLNIISEDDTEYVDYTIQKRIKANKLFLANTSGGSQIINGGGIGLLFDSYIKIFINELSNQLVDDKFTYFKNILSLMIISDLSEESIIGQFNSLINDQCEDVAELYKATELLKKVTFNG